MQPVVDGAITVSLDQTRDAMRLMAEKARVIAEGAGALALAAALTGEAGEGPIVCIVSGGNIDLANSPSWSRLELIESAADRVMAAEQARWVVSALGGEQARIMVAPISGFPVAAEIIGFGHVAAAAGHQPPRTGRRRGRPLPLACGPLPCRVNGRGFRARPAGLRRR